MDWGGHALKTFTAPNGKNWITDKEFLPSVLPNARILTFGYNANVFDDVVTSRVVDHSNSLLSGLLTYRLDCPVRSFNKSYWISPSLTYFTGPTNCIHWSLAGRNHYQEGQNSLCF